MEVTNRRPQNPEGRLNELEAKKNVLAKTIYTIEEIEEDFEKPLWKEITNKMTQQIKGIDDSLYNFEKFSDKEIFGMLGQRKTAVNVISIEEFAKSRERFEVELEKVKKEIGEIRASAGRK